MHHDHSAAFAVSLVASVFHMDFELHTIHEATMYVFTVVVYAYTMLTVIMDGNQNTAI